MTEAFVDESRKSFEATNRLKKWFKAVVHGVETRVKVNNFAVTPEHGGHMAMETEDRIKNRKRWFLSGEQAFGENFRVAGEATEEEIWEEEQRQMFEDPGFGPMKTVPMTSEQDTIHYG